MSRTKKTLLSQNKHQDSNEDLDWDYKPVNDASVNKMWEIKSIKDDCVYKIWAPSYKIAVELLPMIESF